MAARKLGTAIGVLLSLTGCVVASGQISPPPAAQPAPAKAEMPAPPPPPPDPSASATRTRPPPSTGNSRNVPNVEYVSIAKRDDAGVLIPVEGNLEFLALKHNPLVMGEHIEIMKPIVVEWVDRVDNLVLDNADIVLDIDGGLFTNMDLEDQSAVWVANQVIMSMVSAGKLSNYLEKRGMLLKEQAAFNQKIVSEYMQAFSTDLAAASQTRHGANPQAQFNDMAKNTLNQLASDALWDLDRMVSGALEVLPEALKATALEAREQQRILRTVTNAPDKLRAMKDEMRQMDYENIKAILDASRRLRPFDVNVLDDAKVKPDGTGEAPSHYKEWRAQ